MDIAILDTSTGQVDIMRNVDEDFISVVYADDMLAYLEDHGYNVDYVQFMCHDNIKVNHKFLPSDTSRSIWARVGMTLYGTKEEINKLLTDGDASSILNKNQYVFDGDSYIPEDCVSHYNEDYEENFEVGDYDFDV